MTKGAAKHRVLRGIGIMVAVGVVGVTFMLVRAQIQARQEQEQRERAWAAQQRLETEWLSFKQERLMATWRRELNEAKARVVDEKLGQSSAAPDPILAAAQRVMGTRVVTLQERVDAIATKIEQAPKVCDAQIDALRITVADEQDARAKAMEDAHVDFEPADTSALRDLKQRPLDLAVRDRLDWGMCREWYEKVYALNHAPRDVLAGLQRMADEEARTGMVKHYTREDAERAPMASVY